MKYPLSIALILTVAVAGSAVAADDGSRTGPLRVMYVGNTETERGRSYVKFLVSSSRTSGMGRRTDARADVGMPAGFGKFLLRYSGWKS